MMTDNRPDDTAPNPEPRFSQEQYDMLLRCSQKEDITEWNERREKHAREEILLEGVNLFWAHLEGADLRWAHLEKAQLSLAHLEGATLLGAHLEGAQLADVHLEDANLTNAVVDRTTQISGCSVNRHTNFTAVSLDAARVEPGLRQLLQCNIRRKRWEEWYRAGPWWFKALKWTFVSSFFWISDYGRLTYRIIMVFLALALAFAVVYFYGSDCRSSGTEGLVANLFETPAGPVPCYLVPLRAAYFSVVTMTTLGFGDMYAAPGSIVGHLLLMVQVLLGYILLGALITRFAVLFAADGPSAEFAEEPKRDDKDTT